MKTENPTIEIYPGITRRTVAHGKTMYQMMATLAAGSTMPAHSHPQEQIVHILEGQRSEEHTSELQSHSDLVCRLLLEKKKRKTKTKFTPSDSPPSVYDTKLK